ncbi:unnamed protein product [Cylindrotheca closterium]|uniref:Adhesin domain-containing protein n=1 Tax=Cylindrotheca closterium TaxID=2856 RepID=A0AAD2CCZ0_9STRA|nr:unnamed protein product [Cylindrotheca closterium]
MGRKESHVMINLDPKDAIQIEKESKQPLSHPRARDRVETKRVILDDGSIFPDSEHWSNLPEGFRRIEYNDDITHVKEADENVEEPETLIEVDVPEKVNLECDLVNGGSVQIQNKIEGDVRIITADGDVVVQKVRGHTIEIQAFGQGNSIAATDLLEAESITVNLPNPGRLRAMKIHANSFEAQIGEDRAQESEQLTTEIFGDDDTGAVCDISSLYVTGEALINLISSHEKRQAVRVKSNHGHVVVEAVGIQSSAKNYITGETLPTVYMGGVNGSCEVFIRGDASKQNGSKWTSCQVHFDSISPQSVSVVQADVGNVTVTVDRKVETDLRMLASSKVSAVDIDALVEEDTNDGLSSDLKGRILVLDNSVAAGVRKAINIKTKAFTEREIDISLQNSEYIDGWLENKSEEPDSRFDRKTRGTADGSVGKIRLEGAQDQALRGFQDKEQGTNIFQRPLLLVTSAAEITVETLSWLGNVARRYGLNDNRDKEMLGRTATRRGRSFVHPPGKE